MSAQTAQGLSNHARVAWDVTSRPWLYGSAVATLGAIYFVAAKLGLALAFTAEQITLVWPPTGIALAAILLFGYRIWPGIALGAFLANVTTPHETIATAAGIAIGNTLEAVVGAWLLDRFVGLRRTLERFRDVLGLVVFGALISTVISATIGVSSLCLTGVQPWNRFGSLWPIWWLGDTIGDLLFAPVILVWATWPQKHWRQWEARRVVEAVCLGAALVTTTLLVFMGYWMPLDRLAGLEFLIFPFIIWAAVRFGHLATTLASVFVSVIALWAATSGLGPLGGRLDDVSLAVLQSFMGILAVSGLLLSAAMSERDTADRHRTAGHAVTTILAQATSLDEAAPRIVSTVCETLGWDVGAYWNVDDDSQELRCIEVWHQPWLTIPDFEADTRQRRFKCGEGLPGTVWASGRTVWIPDVMRDKNFLRAGSARNAGLHGAFGFPIRRLDRYLGVIEFFSCGVQEPDDRLTQLMTTLGGQIGQLIERSQSQQALRSAQAQLETVTDTMAAAVARCSRDLRYIWASRGYAELLGIPPDEFAGRPIVEIMGPTAFAAIQPRVEQVLRGERVEYEDRVDFKLIGPRWIHAVYVPTCDANGVPDGWVAVVTDQTRRKELEEASRRLAAIVESSDDAIIGKTLDGTIVSWNPGAEGLYGYCAAEIIGKPVSILVPPDRQHEIAGLLQRVRYGGAVEQVETIHCRKDGTTVDISITVSPIRDSTSAIIGASSIARDITERKHFERELREADRRKDEFLGMLAHELRNPLAVISNASQVLERMESPDAQTGKLRSMITRQTQALARMVDDLLDVSRLSQGKIKLDKQPLEVTTVLRRAVEAVRLHMESKRHTLEVSPCNDGIWIEADPTRLEQILVNLLNNAAKYTDPRGRIQLNVRRQGRDVVFTVHDSGIGISPEMLPRVFDLFTQADNSFARSQGGLGIGLFLVQSLARMHGGSVSAHSNGVGQGSAFSITLPALPDESPGPPTPPTTAGSHTKRKRVLVVDDNPEVAESMVLLLTSLGHDATAVYSGAAALEAARTAHPELMFVDLGMPDTDGYEVARQVRADHDMTGILLFALSGYGSEEDQRRSKSAGFDGHLVKPVDSSTLLGLLSTRH